MKLRNVGVEVSCEAAPTVSKTGITCGLFEALALINVMKPV